MVERNECSDIKYHIKQLRDEFDKKIVINPYLINLSQNIVDLDETSEKANYSKYLLLILLGAGVPSIIIAIYLFFYKNDNQIFKILIYTGSIGITLLITIQMYLIRETINQTQLKLKNKYFKAICFTIALPLFLGIISSFSRINEIIFAIIPIVNYVIFVFLMFNLFKPLSSEELRNIIIQKTKSIHDKLDAINKFIVIDSHTKVLKKIEDVEKEVNSKGCTNLIHSITVLDSLRLELIKNSVNGINFVENWKFLDIAQNMIEEIMNCENKKIVIVGDMSFLSTKDGLTRMVKTIVEKNKTFQIYFTGTKPDGVKHIISDHCNQFVNNLKKKYGILPEIEKLKESIKLFPILSDCFTGIGFIGLRVDNDTDEDKEFEKVYAFVSSLLINVNEHNNDITRLNPFVFSWGAETKYFKSFLKSKMVFSDDQEVLINGKPIKANELLNCNTY